MPSSWTDYPATSTTPIKAVHINEVRAAVNAAGGTPPGGWTDGPTVSPTTPIRAKHLTELKDAIQTLWNNRTLGLMAQWTSGSDPGGPSLGTAATPIRASDINDVRRWFNYYETWGDLRGVHWFNYSLTDLPKLGWNIETVIGVSNPDNTYNSSAVNSIKDNCTSARNYGLVNIVRLDWKQGEAAPKNSGDYASWRANFNQAVNDLKSVATIFIVGNEPTIEASLGGMSSTQYADAFNNLYPTKVAGTLYLPAGPAAWSTAQSSGETDLVWLDEVANKISALDGFALHSYQSIEEQCVDPRVPCGPLPQPLTGDKGFRRYRDYIERIRDRYPGKPVYLTEFNTHGYGAQSPADRTPEGNYPTGFMQQAYEEVRNYNTETNPNRPSYPRVLCACWFVDDFNNPERRHDNWSGYALSNTGATRLAQARSDLIASNTSTGITA